ncbi:MAG TPA: beta-ketoacyl synthase N-terminal-like domain-containing protein, partial [Candidatus Obscuribacterales bacterium]
PDQAKALEALGIKTYLHVPSPLLLSSFIEMGARRFIFEGRECGGHVGPRSSFVLWEQMIATILSSLSPREDASQYHILFAGGIHDALSAAMVQAMVAPLAQRGINVGVLIGTAYLFTEEAVTTGAIVKRFQEAAVKCEETVLLETGPGHAIRCIDSPYKKTFDDKHRSLLRAQKSRDEIREELELMNLGRLRIASKGVARADGSSTSGSEILAELGISNNKAKESKLVALPDEKQWADGMYMIGQIASLHNKVITIAELHKNVSDGSLNHLQEAACREDDESTAAVLPGAGERDSAATVNGAAAGRAGAKKTGKASAGKVSSRKRELEGEKPAAPDKAATSKAATSAPGRKRENDIAIVGMSCIFPKAADVESYWQNILNKVDAIIEIPPEQWDWREYYDENPLARDKIYSKWGGFIDHIQFEPAKYGIPPSSLASIDPMQLLLLELTDRALNDAGYGKRPFPRERTSVVLANAGHGPMTALYSLRSMLGWKLAQLDPAAKKQIEDALPEWTEDSFPGYLGNVAAGRIANRFDLGGLNFSIDAACASSLAALHTAVGELRSGNSDFVILGAIDTHNQPSDYLSFSKVHAFSKGGKCRTFDASADGIVISEGLAMVILKRLTDAERDGDKIYAVIAGVGGSSDGRDLSLTAPRPQGQMLALRRAYADAGINPATVGLVEAHGTGTVAGDKAEIEALRQVFDGAGAARQECAVGSVKTMIGHTKAAAGLASLIKVAKALHHKVLPPTIGVTTPNPACDFANSPFYISSETRPWLHSSSKAGYPRRAGVSAFGFGGTNFHTVLEEYEPVGAPVEKPAVMHWPSELFLLKGRTRQEIIKSVQALIEAVRRNLEKASEREFTRFAFNHNLKPAAHTNELCLAIVASNADDLIDKLKRAQSDLIDGTRSEIKDPRGIYFVDLTEAPAQKRKAAFLFPGQGSQQINMLRDLSLALPIVRRTFEKADETLDGILPRKLSSYIFPPPAFSKDEEKARQEELTNTHIAQPAMGAADMAMLRLVSLVNLKPDFLAGHSYGEYAALAAAGVFSEEDLYRISEIRGRLFAKGKEGESGTMAAVSGDAEQVQSLLRTMRGITLANINSPNQCVISGDANSVESALSALKQEKIAARTIPVSQAFHSEHMAHAKEPLRKALKSLRISSACIPTYSNTDASVYPNAPDEVVEKLTEHIVKPVDFVTEIRRMHEDGAYFFIEVGPGSVLTNLVDSILADKPHLAVALDRSGRPGTTQLLFALAQLAAHGVPFDLRPLFDERLEYAQAADAAQAAQLSKQKKLIYHVNSTQIWRPDAGPAINAAAKPASQTQVSSASMAQQTAAPASSAAAQSRQNPAAPDKKEFTTRMSANTSLNATVKAPAAPGTSNAAPGTNNAASMPHQQKTTVFATTNSSVPAEPPQGMTAAAMPVPAINPAPQMVAGANNIDQVMLHFQKTMLEMTNSFLVTQQQVMLAYFSAKQGAGSNQLPGLPPAFAQSANGFVPFNSLMQPPSAHLYALNPLTNASSALPGYAAEPPHPIHSPDHEGQIPAPMPAPQLPLPLEGADALHAAPAANGEPGNGTHGSDYRAFHDNGASPDEGNGQAAACEASHDPAMS